MEKIPYRVKLYNAIPFNKESLIKQSLLSSLDNYLDALYQIDPTREGETVNSVYKSLSHLAACHIVNSHCTRSCGTHLNTAINNLHCNIAILAHINHANGAIGILHARCLIYTYPIETCLVGVCYIGMGSPSIVTYALIEDKVEMLVERPLSLIQLWLVCRF